MSSLLALFTCIYIYIYVHQLSFMYCPVLTSTPYSKGHDNPQNTSINITSFIHPNPRDELPLQYV
ncbi:uncharacterized protein BDW43DRAFT_258035, partial [Aspergillus alliaceus]|uniref:uncharacterized protein n=1 Tax=Petromyces alliaceus TaxID=209559 RepID=UPI0012A6CBD1